MPFMEIKVIRDAMTRNALPKMARQQFGDMVKADVDVDQGIMALVANSILTKRGDALRSRVLAT